MAGVTGVVAYSLAPSNTKTVTVVKVEPAKAAPAATKSAAKTLKCIPGAAAGSCNTDEAAEALKDRELPANR